MPLVFVKQTRLYPGQVWRLKSPMRDDTIRLFIIEDFVSENEIYFYGMSAPFSSTDFLWLEPIKDLQRESHVVQLKAFEEFKRWDLQPSMYIPIRGYIYIIAFFFSILLLYLLSI